MFLFMAQSSCTMFSFPCSADQERDWPPCKVVFFGLATNTLCVRNNFSLNNSNNQLMYCTTKNVTYLFMALKVYCCTTGNKHKIHRTRGRPAFSVVCHVPANIQATSAVECDLWYGVRRPYVAPVFRCYTDFEIVTTLKITAPNLRALGSFQSF